MFKKSITHHDIEKNYEHYPSIIDRLPWRDFNEQYRCFLLEDNMSLGVCFKITPIACEARPEAMLSAMSQSIRDAINNSVPCSGTGEWLR